MTFELGGLEDQRHGGGVHVLVRKLDIGEIAPDASNNFAPKTRAFQHIRLVDGEQASAASSGEFEGNAGDALNLRFAVAHGVERLARASSAFDGAGLAKVQSAEQFSHYENVGSFDDFFPQRRAGGQRRIKDGGTEIGERSKFLAEPQQSGFGAQFARIAIEGGTADRPE